MSHSVDETYDVYDERFPRARKEHVCEACKETIRPGHRYARVHIVYDGSAHSIIRCLRCQKIHEHLRTLGDYETWPDERLACGQRYEDEWGELPDEVAKLAFVSADEIQAELATEKKVDADR